MKYYTKKWYKEMQIAGFLVFPETKEEWEDEVNLYKQEGIDIQKINEENLIEIRDDLLEILPEYFYPYIKNGTINSIYPSNDLKVNIDKWLKLFEEKNKLNDSTYNNYYGSIKNKLPKFVFEICERTLHDSTIEIIDNTHKDNFIMVLDLNNSFYDNKYMKLTFTGVKEDITVPTNLKKSVWIYNEVYLKEDGFELNILFDSPLFEFKIEAENLRIESIGTL